MSKCQRLYDRLCELIEAKSWEEAKLVATELKTVVSKGEELPTTKEKFASEELLMTYVLVLCRDVISGRYDQRDNGSREQN